jgi:hypothetical protein
VINPAHRVDRPKLTNPVTSRKGPIQLRIAQT